MLSFRLDERLRSDLQKLSKKSKRPESELAREAARRFVAHEELRRIRATARPLAQAGGILTDENIFKFVS